MPEQVFGPAKPEFALKDADPDIPILKEAKAEYAKLQFALFCIVDWTTDVQSIAFTEAAWRNPGSSASPSSSDHLLPKRDQARDWPRWACLVR
jgi:hypothetical protein